MNPGTRARKSVEYLVGCLVSDVVLSKPLVGTGLDLSLKPPLVTSRYDPVVSIESVGYFLQMRHESRSQEAVFAFLHLLVQLFNIAHFPAFYLHP